jgi:hypothetical protein
MEAHRQKLIAANQAKQASQQESQTKRIGQENQNIITVQSMPVDDDHENESTEPRETTVLKNGNGNGNGNDFGQLDDS